LFPAINPNSDSKFNTIDSNYKTFYSAKNNTSILKNNVLIKKFLIYDNLFIMFN